MGLLFSRSSWKLVSSSTRIWQQTSLYLLFVSVSLVLNFYAKHSNRKESPDSRGNPGTVAPGKTGLQESCRPPKRKRTRMTICTYNARTLASDAAIEDLMMQARMIKYDVNKTTETRRRQPLNAVYDIGEELFSRTCDGMGVGGIGISVNTSMELNTDSFEQLTT
ncbi:hypothetical protein RB195_024417 [Necator americanus]|uniref:Uncharacterized protein n=1 Tax=Necator americanus TaxID=51031 RepID=A0ABR1EN68_NECAM